MIALCELFEPRERVAVIVRSRSSFLVFFSFSNAVCDDADWGEVQPHELTPSLSPCL